MLIFGGDPTPPAQKGRPFPPIRFALVVPPKRKGTPVLHAFGCSNLPPFEIAKQLGIEIVYSTTYREIDDHASHQFGEDGWAPCEECGGWDT